MDTTRFTVADFLDPVLCRGLIAETESLGYTDAPITTPWGFERIPEVRNNTRVMLDDPARAAALWDKLSPLVNDPATFGGWRPLGLNERLRFYRYTPGQHFRWHLDGAFMRSPRERSRWTFMVYLNDDFEGGGTDFEDGVTVRPVTGAALVFAHGLRHQGAEVTRGTKYVLRSDVMFVR